MKILYYGTSEFALPALRALLASEHRVAAVVTQPDRPAGRGRAPHPPPVKELALAHGLPALQPESCRTPEFLAEARSYEPDLGVLAAYGQFLPDALRAVPRLGTVNLHGSLLPKYRGAAPVQRAIWRGETVTGVSLLWMAREMDAGDLIACAEEHILPEDNAGTLAGRLANLAADLLLAWLPAIEHGTAPRIPQDHAQATFAPMIGKAEREINWGQPAEAIWRQVRALAPSPAATTAFRGVPVKLLEARPASPLPAERAAPGEIVSGDPKTGLIVATGAGTLQVLSILPAGKRAMSGGDFLRGYRVTPGERFAAAPAGRPESC